MSSPSIQTDRACCPSSHGFGNKLGRVAWGIVWLLLFRPSPVPFRWWRRLLLRCFGTKVSRGANVLPSVRIWAPWNLTLEEEATMGEFVNCYCVAPITIGANATVSQGAHLCAASHELSDPAMRLVTAPIRIEAGAWVCADAFVGMGITVGEGAVVGARSVVTKDVAPWTIVGGNPAKYIKDRTLKA